MFVFYVCRLWLFDSVFCLFTAVLDRETVSSDRQQRFTHLLALLSALCVGGSDLGSCPSHTRSESPPAPCEKWMNTCGGTGSRWRGQALPTCT